MRASERSYKKMYTEFPENSTKTLLDEIRFLIFSNKQPFKKANRRHSTVTCCAVAISFPQIFYNSSWHDSNDIPKMEDHNHLPLNEHKRYSVLFREIDQILAPLPVNSCSLYRHFQIHSQK